ncbi:gamma-glutamylcyclotransferase [Bosea sp. (in: a-proteobacteria)]|jgi:cation transport protein ChaC|uniref:gamma-glutamylcyclotransferase n=1 Tax=Bosea sp. (in: a-proteobacteria) TaxID=1871050 RepID=UPI003F7065EB
MTPDAASDDLWVFGYGSLIWRPGFRFEESLAARLNGYHRSLCVFSHVHRGTPERPGLVLGLDRGGICRGLAFKVAAAHAGETVAYLREREQATSVYLERHLPVRLEDGRRVKALVYVADRRHLQYAGRLPAGELLKLVRQGRGSSGENPDYVLRTHDHLHKMGIFDPVLAALAEELAPGLTDPRPAL